MNNNISYTTKLESRIVALETEIVPRLEHRIRMLEDSNKRMADFLQKEGDRTKERSEILASMKGDIEAFGGALS